MQSSKDLKDLDNFLAKVDNLNSIIKGFTSNDSKLQAEAVEKADIELEKHRTQELKTTFDRTIIQKTSDDTLESGPTFHETQTSQGDFLASMEEDCRRRTAARKERHRKANEVKELGNSEFKTGNFGKAVEYYTEATAIAKDLTPLYTNRAAAYIKLEKYQEAVEDCDFALRIDEQWIKANVLMGKALQKLHKFDEAKEKFEDILKIDGTKTRLFSDCIAGLEEDEKNYKLEMETQSKDGEGMSIESLISSLGSGPEDGEVHPSSSNLMYYAGGFRMLQTLLIDEQSRTLFRTKGGFKIISTNENVFECMRSMLGGDTKPHSDQVVSAFISMCTAACTEMPENLRNLLSQPGMPQILLGLLEHHDDHVRRDAIAFFHEMALHSRSRIALLPTIDCHKLAVLLLKPNTRKADANSAAAATLCNLFLEKKFVNIIANATELLDLYTGCVDELGINSYQALSLRMRGISSLTLHPHICASLSNNQPFITACIGALERCAGMFVNGCCNPCGMKDLLQILVSVMRSKKQEESIYRGIVTQLRPMINKTKDDDLLSTCLHLMSLSLERCEDAVDILMSGGHMMRHLFNNLKNEDMRLRTHSLKIICCCGRSDVKHIKPLLTLDKDYLVIRDILMIGEEDADKVNQGQIAYLLGLLSVIPGGLHSLLKSNVEGCVVRRLLVLCRDLPGEQSSSNCAIALGKMAHYDTRFLEELRKHDGINILSRRKAPV